ncbi:hypothetical protein PUN28_020525 [Cardiocondyla obscurior]|uniref:Secreted protein n=1 Tax=Cardiocondyla obscurior TaxID=286306 RepID=A0AAW2E864_9HYME
MRLSGIAVACLTTPLLQQSIFDAANVSLVSSKSSLRAILSGEPRVAFGSGYFRAVRPSKVREPRFQTELLLWSPRPSLLCALESASSSLRAVWRQKCDLVLLQLVASARSIGNYFTRLLCKCRPRVALEAESLTARSCGKVHEPPVCANRLHFAIHFRADPSDKVREPRVAAAVFTFGNAARLQQVEPRVFFRELLPAQSCGKVRDLINTMLLCSGLLPKH